MKPNEMCKGVKKAKIIRISQTKYCEASFVKHFSQLTYNAVFDI